jgi:hypothetical protein
MMTLEELDILGKKYYYEYDYPNALLCYAEVFARYPFLAQAYNNYGMILRAMGQPKLAYNFFKTAIDLDPEDRNFPFNLATTYLLKGDLNNGWEQFETRWRFKHHEHVLTSYEKPQWTGEDISGKRLIIICEEGAGDNFQFCRFTEEIHNMGIDIIHVTEPEWKTLFHSSFPYTTVIDNTETLPEYDYWIPILSIPKVLKVTYDNLKNVTNYIKPNNTAIAKWDNIVKDTDKIRVGLCWEGRSRSFPFEKLLSLIKSNSEVEWVNFQVMCDNNQRQFLVNSGVLDYSNHIYNWEDTAALMNTIDIFISIDTGLCHLAASMNKTCLLLLDRYNSCWRWLLDKNDSFWYPSIKIIRQQLPNVYDDQLIVIDEYIKDSATKKGSVEPNY